MTSALPTDGATSELASLVRTAWTESLGHDEFHDEENFFLVGGHSMCALRIVRTLKRELGAPLTVRQFFAHPTVTELAAFLAGAAPVSGGPGTRAGAGA
ncbi:phosphopantetheine binding protein [Streptomyces sp. 840.1]|uniref:acyl carrier protein n=1 Tax=Streptomyces sp. 840.1 TaxID=2485152 RepID=UPI000FAC27B3|nr:acyl carrier protein [Streptomyces sp. 840.1]ROQ57392.1 phosphopantetheine binding protein [Streptomyces sp. 840.1]